MFGHAPVMFRHARVMFGHAPGRRRLGRREGCATGSTTPSSGARHRCARRTAALGGRPGFRLRLTASRWPRRRDACDRTGRAAGVSSPYGAYRLQYPGGAGDVRVDVTFPAAADCQRGRIRRTRRRSALTPLTGPTAAGRVRCDEAPSHVKRSRPNIGDRRGAIMGVVGAHPRDTPGPVFRCWTRTPRNAAPWPVRSPPTATVGSGCASCPVTHPSSTPMRECGTGSNSAG
jgi:hypothetical protein